MQGGMVKKDREKERERSHAAHATHAWHENERKE